VDLARRVEFLLAGLGWCRLPEQLVAEHIGAGRLIRLTIEDDPSPAGSLTIYAAHMRDRPLRRAGAWLLDDLRTRFTSS
jgi:DNA-binding transcriptional LysR family regulator